MKTTNTLLTVLAGLLLSAAAYAQVEVTVTGSTAFRAITIDRSASIFDAGYVAVTNNASTGLITYSGTVATAVPSLGSTPVKVRLSFSGSASGMLAVKNLSLVSTADTPGNNVNRVPDLALSDVFPGSATPPIPDSAFERSVLGVIPFVWVINNALTGISNITREQAVLLMNSSGAFSNGVVGMPATYLGGSSTNPVYLIGRDSGSGTRISTEKDIGFVGAPLLWATNGAGIYVVTNGYSSGGLERAVIAGKPDAIGYLGRADLAAIAATATAISYEGVPYSEPAVAGGSYAMWGYEHIVNRVGGVSANQALVRDALIKAITDSAYQSTAIYTNSFVRLNQMQVERGADGGTITSLNF
jgi:phosphate transport system substrate-binding protein